MHLFTRRARVAAAAIAGVMALSLAACSDDDGDKAEAAPPPTAQTADHGDHDDHPTVVVDGVDYGYEHLPAEIPAGTRITFRNVSDKEFHEMIVVRIPDEETRSVQELAALSPEENEAIFGELQPALVAVAGPGEDGVAVVGDGVISEPGRYAVVCYIPIGADPDALRQAMESPEEAPADLMDGQPHYEAGMYAEFVVTEA